MNSALPEILRITQDPNTESVARVSRARVRAGIRGSRFSPCARSDDRVPYKMSTDVINSCSAGYSESVRIAVSLNSEVFILRQLIRSISESVGIPVTENPVNTYDMERYMYGISNGKEAKNQNAEASPGTLPRHPPRVLSACFGGASGDPPSAASRARSSRPAMRQHALSA